jgi:O-methyltransferase involved in polyketide biosynthesis
MIIADTSALVLNWTSKEVWKSRNARNYFSELDLSAADVLYQLFDEKMDHLQTQLLSNRKYFTRKTAIEFLEQCKNRNEIGQVIILAAGIDPLSVELASFYPESRVFDVDKYSLKEKEKLLKQVCGNIQFVECDITNIELLKEKLVAGGWNEKQPGIVILEGITYYLTVPELKKVLRFAATNTSGLTCDFGIAPECVNERNRRFGIEIVNKIVKTVGIEFMNCFPPVYFMNLLEDCGFKNPQRVTMAAIQKERTGSITPFEGHEAAWISMIKV